MLEQSPSGQASSTAPEASSRPERLRFTSFTFDRSPAGRTQATVTLEWGPGTPITGTASGQSTPVADLRIAGEATLAAIARFTQDALRLELAGIKAVRAFDATVVIAAINVPDQTDGPRRLLGCSLVENDPLRGAVVAVLNATNRVLGNYVARR